MREKRNVLFCKKIFKRMISYLLIVGMVCSGFPYNAVFAAETTESTPTIRLYLEKPEGWTTPAFHMWNEDAVVLGDGEVFVQSWDSYETKLVKQSSGELYYVDVTLKGWHGFQFIDAESGDEIKVDYNVEADADILAAFSQMTEDTSVYYVKKNGAYGWYLDANGTKPLEVPKTIYANIHFYNENEWKTPCVDVWADGMTTTYTNVGTQTKIKGWDHTLPAMKEENENWYTATVQITGKLTGMQFVDAETGNIIMLDAKQLTMIGECTGETPTDVYYGYETISFKKEDIPIPKQLVKRPSPIYHTDGTVTFHLATEEKQAGIKGTFTNWLTMPMEQVSEAEDGFVGFTVTVKVPTEGGIYTYGMVTGAEEQWIGDPENKSKTDNPVVIRNPEIGNGTATIYWPATEKINGKVMYRKYESKDAYRIVKFQPVVEAQNLYEAEIDQVEGGEKYEYIIEIDGEVQEDTYNLASKENGVAIFVPGKELTEPGEESPVIKETLEPTITPTVSVTATVQPTKIPEETAVPSIMPSATPSTTSTIVPSATAISTVEPTILPTETANPIPEETVTPSVVPSIAPTASVVPEESTPASYTITYVLNKGTNHKDNPAFYTTRDVNLKAPTRVGYTFAGWYSDKNYTEKIVVIKADNKKDITIYAKWNKVKKPAKVKTITVKNKKGTKVKITVKKIQNAKGYEILYAKDRKFKKSVKKCNITGNVKTIGKLQRKQIYYIKVRAYKIDSAGKKVYGAYSSVKKIRITK